MKPINKIEINAKSIIINMDGYIFFFQINHENTKKKVQILAQVFIV